MRLSKDAEEILIKRLDRFEEKLDRLLESIVPEMETKIALTQAKSSTSARITAAIGGILAVATSAAIAWFEH